jgi:hypothetical protein
MFPDQQNQNSGQPGYGQVPQAGVSNAPQQAPNGQYAVVPPLPIGQNNGHTGHNPYEFIVNPNTPQKHGGLTGVSFGKQLAVLVGGAIVLLVVAAMVLSALKPKGIGPDMVAIAQRQEEIVRIATAAAQQASSQDTKNFVITTQLSLSSQQQQVIGYLTTNSIKTNAKLLGIDHTKQTDTLLADAANAGTYDSVVVTTLNDQLKTYEGQLQTTYKKATGKTSKKILQNSYTAAVSLQKQAASLQTPRQP